MKKYIILTSDFWYDIDNNGKNFFKKTFIGFLDADNVRNTVSIRDVLLDRRISEVLFNMGVQFTVKTIPTMIANNPKKMVDLFYLESSTSEYVDKNVFDFVHVNADLTEFDYTYGTPDECKETRDNVFNAFKNALHDYTDVFNDEDIYFILDKIALPAEMFYSCQTRQEYPIENNINIDYILYGGKFDDYTDAVHVITPSGYILTEPENMDNPTDDLPFHVPSFCSLVCYDKYLQEVVNYNLNTDDDGEVSLRVTDLSDTTSFFEDNSTTSNDKAFSFKDIYLPFNANIASVTTLYNKIVVPKISFCNVKVDAVTKFWRVNPADNIPKEAFGVNPHGKRYDLEDLIGHANQNNLPLQPNETAYYKSLENLMKIAVSIEHGAISEDVYKEKSSNTSTVVEEYLKTLSEQAFNLMWCHTGTTQPVVNDNALDDDFDDDSGDTVVPYQLHCWRGTVSEQLVNNKTEYRFVPFYNDILNRNLDANTVSELIHSRITTELSRLNAGFDGSIDPGFVHYNGALVGYINERSDNHRWIDALIRLLRWGERKPSMLTNKPLVAGNGDDNGTGKYWNLNECSVSSHDGNISDKEPEIDEVTGNAYHTTSILYCDLQLPTGMYKKYYPDSPLSKDTSGVIDMRIPMGVVLEEKMKDCDCYRSTFEDIFTYYDKLINGEKRGQIIFENGKFKSVYGDDVVLGELALNDALSKSKKKTVYVNDAETGKAILLEFAMSSNAKIISSRSEILSAITDVEDKLSYKTICSLVDIFSSFNSYARSPIKEPILRLGSELQQRKYYSRNEPYSFNPEMSRIVFNYLDKFGQLRYTSNNGYSLISILNKLHEINQTVLKKSNESNEDLCFKDFYDRILPNVNNYVFLKLFCRDRDLRLIAGISRDKSNPTFVVMNDGDFNKLTKSVSNKPQLRREELKTQKDRGITILRVAVQCWYDNNYTLDKAHFIKVNSDGTKYPIIISSEDTIKLAEQVLKKLNVIK